MEHSKPLSVDSIYVSTVFFEQEGNFLVAPEDGIVERRKAFIILFVDPLFFTEQSVLFWLVLNQLIISF